MRKINVNVLVFLAIAIGFSLRCESKTGVSNNSNRDTIVANVNSSQNFKNSVGKDYSKLAIISFVSSNSRFSKDQKAPTEVTLHKNEVIWRGERANIQVLVFSQKSMDGFSLKATNFIRFQGGTFSANALNYGFVKYVGANISGGMCGKISQNLPSVEIADAISPKKTTTINEGSVQPIWITIDVPATAIAGKYTTKISFSSSNSANFDTLTLDLDVKNRVLPLPSKWAFHLDLWQYPLREAAYYNVKPWSAEHFEHMKTSMKELANAGQKAVTASFFWDVFSMENMKWGEENLMVRIKKSSDGKFIYDFTNFDKWINFMMGMGIKDQINCFGVYPTNSNFEYYYKDFAEQKAFKKTFALLSNEYNTFWIGLLRAFSQHLKSKGWMEKTVIFIDERAPDKTKEVIKLIKSADALFKIGYSGAYNSMIEDDLDDFSIASYLKIPANVLKGRKTNNKITTFYTCCTEKKPNTFTYSSPAESVFMGWFSFANNYDGYLRWAYDMWEKNSLTDTQTSYIPAGDGLLVYPENHRSIRFEKLREGIQDFEKMKILKAEFIKTNNGDGIKKLNLLLNLCMLNRVSSIGDYEKLIEKLQEGINAF